MNMEILRGQHDEISLLARELRTAVDSAQRPLVPARWRLARLLMAHLAVEDRYLYPSMVESADRNARNMALSFQLEMGALASSFSDYMAFWSNDRILTEWDMFAAETRGILDTLERRVDKENRLLYPLAPDGWLSLQPLPALKSA